MFIVLLKFAENKSKAPEFMDGHNQWIKRGFDEGIFLLAGSLQPGLGGSILADGESRQALENRVKQDPFVVENVVTPEIFEIEAKMTDGRLDFLLDGDD